MLLNQHCCHSCGQFPFQGQGSVPAHTSINQPVADLNLLVVKQIEEASPVDFVPTPTSSKQGK